MTSRIDAERRLAIELHRLVAATGDLAHHYAAAGEIGSTDFAALLHIWEAGLAGASLTPSQLAAKLNVTPAAATYVVDRLSQRGYVERTPNPEDRRQVLLQVSAPGGQVTHGYTSPDWFGRTLASRTDTELASVTEILTDLTAAITEFTRRPKETPDA